MKFRYIGTPKNITDLRSIASKHKQLERKNVKIAIVDNESFPMIEILQRHKFDIDKFDDIENIESLNGYDIILCDIQGVGTKFNEVFQGAYLVKEIYKRYPFKIIIAYTGSRYDPRYNEYLKYAEYNIIKDASSEEWVEKLDSYPENSNKRGIDIMRQNTNIIKANLSSDCVVSNAYLLFFANSNSLFVINEYIANNNAVKEISKAKKLDL